jgi:hypothetical protein
MSLVPYLERDHYLLEHGVFTSETFYLSTPSVGAEFLVDKSMFLRTPSVGAAYIYVGVHDLDLGSMINLSTRVNKT